MLWVIETNQGAFEAPTKRKIISDIVKYFGENKYICFKIKSINCVLKSGEEKEICVKVVSLIQDMIQENIYQYIEELEILELQSSPEYFFNQI
tara:strand:- start:1117 stop:1395 length:279 start_codon:yes stop_codon:yes gene_type:complete